MLRFIPKYRGRVDELIKEIAQCESKMMAANIELMFLTEEAPRARKRRKKKK